MMEGGGVGERTGGDERASWAGSDPATLAETSGVPVARADSEHRGNLRPFYPEDGGGSDVAEWVARVVGAGFLSAPAHFMRASGAAGVGLAPDVGSVFEAE